MFSSTNNPKTYTRKNLLIIRGILLTSLLLIVLILITILGESYDMDRRFSSQFFTLEDDWFLTKDIPWNWLYDFGVIPGILMSFFSFILWSYYRTNIKFYVLRNYFLICGFTPIIASLFLVNVVLKDHTGRPRPREISQFNGNWDYKPVFEVGIPGKGHSFPCGHCSIAFTLTSGIIFFRQSRKFAFFSFSLGLTYGILMSMARIVQGGHFITDAIWSLGIVWFTLILLYYFIFQPSSTEHIPTSPFSKKQKWKIVATISIVVTVLTVFVFTRRPFYKNHIGTFKINNVIKNLELYVPNNWVYNFKYFDNIKEGEFLLEIKGFAPPFTTHYLNFITKNIGETMKLNFKENVFGYQRNFKQSLKISLPYKFKDSIKFIKEKHKKNIIN